MECNLHGQKATCYGSVDADIAYLRVNPTTLYAQPEYAGVDYEEPILTPTPDPRIPY